MIDYEWAEKPSESIVCINDGRDAETGREKSGRELSIATARGGSPAEMLQSAGRE